MIPPVFMAVRFSTRPQHNWYIPIPLFLLWPLIVILPLLALPLLAIIEAALYSTPYRWPATRAVTVYLEILSSLRGMKMLIHKKQTDHIIGLHII